MSTVRTTNLQSPFADTAGFQLLADGTVRGTKASYSNISGVGTISGQITLDLSQANNFTLTLGGTSNLNAPTNQAEGQNGIIFIIQDPNIGSRTLSYSGAWNFPNGNAPTLSTASGAVDSLAYVVRSGGAVDCVFNAAFS